MPTNKEISEALEELKSLHVSSNKQMTDQFLALSTKFDSFTKSQESLVKRVNAQDNDINFLAQRDRGHCLRIMGLKLPADASSITATSRALYEALLPIMKIGFREEKLGEVPSLLQTIDISHTIKTKDEILPIHVRLHSKLVREIILRYKGGYFKTAEQSFSIMEDLTAKNRQLLKSTKECTDVERAWVRNGTIRYRLKNDSSSVHTAKH